MREIETDRLLLRRLNENDAQAIFDNWASDPEVTRYLTWLPHNSVDLTKAILNSWLADYENEGCYRYGIENKETGELMGMIDVVGYEDGIPEIGYVMGRKFWGHGYMPEACKALVNELLEDGYEDVMIEAMVDNKRSNRVIQKCGFHYVRSHERERKNHGDTVTLNTYYLKDDHERTEQ